MISEEDTRLRTSREDATTIFGWLSVGFTFFFVLAFILLALGFGDLREDGVLGMVAFALTLPPALICGAVWLVLRTKRSRRRD